MVGVKLLILMVSIKTSISITVIWGPLSSRTSTILSSTKKIMGNTQQTVAESELHAH
jgi:hypothetical protein